MNVSCATPCEKKKQLASYAGIEKGGTRFDYLCVSFEVMRKIDDGCLRSISELQKQKKEF